MQFYVRRTSTRFDERHPPCDEAFRVVRPYYDHRTFTSFEEHDKKLAPQVWTERGTEHEVLRGPRGGAVGIRRRLEDDHAWAVELDTLEQLVAFRERYGDLVLCEPSGHAPGVQIEIYDDYRE